MNRELLEEAIDAVLLETGDVVHLQSYSGRGMYGKECLGISTDNDSVYQSLLVEMAILNPEIARYMAAHVHTDSMGLGRIYYWPRIPFEKAEDDE